MKSIKSGAVRTRECPLSGIITLFACGALACGEVIFDPEGINGGAGSGQAGRAGSGSGGSSGVSNGGSAGISNGGFASVSNGGSAGSNNTGGGGSGNGNGGNGSGNGNAGTSSGTAGTDDPGADAGDAGEIFSDGGTLDAGASDATPPGPVNLVSNPDFELGFSPWTAAFGGTMAATIDQAHTGAQSGRVTGRTQTYQGAHYNLTSAITPGTAYTVSAFGRISGTSPNAPLLLTARITCVGVAVQYRTIRSATGNDTTWTELTGPLVVPSTPSGTPTSSSCTVTELLIYMEGPPAGFTIYIDDVSVIEQ